MGEYRDEREAALHRAEALAQENARLQTELDAARGGRPTSAATRRTPVVVGAALGAMVFAGAVAGFMASVRRAPVVAVSALELRGTWSPPSPVAPVSLRASVRAGGGTWAVGDRGTIMFRPEGAREWTAVPSGTEADLYAINQQLTAVGANGTILQYDADARRWNVAASPTREHLYAVSDRTNYRESMIVGAHATVLVYSASERAWTSEESRVPDDVTADLFDVAVGVDGRPVIVGAEGTILTHRQNTSMLPMYARQASPTTATLRAVAVWNNTLLAVGDGGVMISATENSPWTLVRANTTENLYAVAATEIPYEERRPESSGSGSTFGFVAAGAHGTVMVDRLGSTEGWRSVRAGGGAIRTMTSEPWNFFTDDGAVIAFAAR